MRKMAEYAKGALTGKTGKAIYINFITQVSPACDCYGHSDAPIVNDIGICASTDPVAIDQACADLVNGARGNEGSALQTRPRAGWRQVPRLLAGDPVGGAAGAWGEGRAGEQDVRTGEGLTVSSRYRYLMMSG